jgi:mono/diheme cytochrome c family protein
MKLQAKLWVLVAAAALPVAAGDVGAVAKPTAAVVAAPPAGAKAFLEQHCLECHDADSAKGDLDLTALAFQPEAGGKAFDEWVKVYDRVKEGEMPPPAKVKGADRPKPPAVEAFLNELIGPMVQADQTRELAEGRTIWRRLNRYEYENAVRDLLHAPWLQIKEKLPEDGESHRFNKGGEALAVSHVHMASYLAAADYALREAMAAGPDRPPTTTTRYYAREQRTFKSHLGFSQFNRSPERSVFPMLGNDPQPDVLEGKAPVSVGAKDPEKRELEAFGVVASTYEPLEMRFDAFTAPVGGHYKLRFATHTFWAGPLNDKKWWTPDRAKISAGRRDEPVTIYSETMPRLLRWLGTFDSAPDSAVKELDVWLLPGETIRPDASRLFRSRPSNWHNPLAEKDGQPGVAFQWMEAEGPIYDQWPTAGHKLMFADLPIKPAEKAGETPEVVSKDPRKDAERLLRGFMAAAYRTPVPEAEVRRFLGVIDGALKSGSSFADAMIAGYSGVLCSPGFLSVEEKPGRLDDYALATRLSLFLWNSPPDHELLSLAAKGKLHEPAVLAAQTDRLLGDEKSSRFVNSFLDYWLDLRKIVATAPDATLYPDYYLDDLLTESAEQETQLFFTQLLKDNLPASNIASSNFAMLNERLAAHYGIPGVKGVALRRVELPAGCLRGGLLTQASVLKVTANGTTTSPVLRGAWIMDRILGKPPTPPPPNLPAIEPDTRGTTTIRQQLDKHRALPSCAVCHNKIDPAGFALESFDVMGGWRGEYRALATNESATNVKPATAPTTGPTTAPAAVPGFGHNGQRFTFHAGPEVDPSGVMPDGRTFADVAELKKLLLQDERQLARNLVQQFVVYSTGAAARFGDRPRVEAILDRAQAEHYRVRTLIREIVQSGLFQMK